MYHLKIFNRSIIYMDGEGNGAPLQYSCLTNPMERGAWWAAVHGVAKSQTWLNNFTFTFPFMHWRSKGQPTPVFLPGKSQGQGKPGGLPSMGWHRVGHDWSDLAAAAAAASGMKKKCIFEIQDCKPLGTGWDFSQDYIGIGYCGMEGDYSFIYNPEILNHSPGSVFFLYWEDWGVTWRTGGDQ